MRDPLAGRMFGATLVSGALSGVTLLLVPGALYVGPGILFGLATAWFFNTAKWLDIVQAAFWVIASTSAWYAAFETYSMYGANPGGGDPSSGLTNMLIAGLVGSGLMSIVLSVLARRVSLKNIIVTAACGVILAAVMFWVLNTGSGTQLTGGDGGLPCTKLATVFGIWQVGVGLSLLAYQPKRVR
jgi:hypothetical protein